MITSTVKSAFEWHKLLFFYLPSYPLAWDADYTKLSVSKSRVKVILWVLFLFDSFLTALGNGYVLVTHYFVNERPTFAFNFTSAVILVLQGFFALTIVMLSCIMFISRKDLVAGLNHMIQVDRRMTQGMVSKLFLLIKMEHL